MEIRIESNEGEASRNEVIRQSLAMRQMAIVAFREFATMVIQLRESGQSIFELDVDENTLEYDENALLYLEFAMKNAPEFAPLLAILRDNMRTNTLKDALLRIYTQVDMASFVSAALLACFEDGPIPRSPRQATAKELQQKFLHFADDNKLSAESANLIVTAAMDDPYCWDFATGWASDYLEAKEIMPSALSEFAVQVLQGRRRPIKNGVHAKSPTLRDLFIKTVAEVMQVRFDYPLEKNVGSKGESISMVIAEALGPYRENLTENAVRKIARRPWHTFGIAGEIVGTLLQCCFPTHFSTTPAKSGT